MTPGRPPDQIAPTYGGTDLGAEVAELHVVVAGLRDQVDQLRDELSALRQDVYPLVGRGPG